MSEILTFLENKDFKSLANEIGKMIKNSDFTLLNDLTQSISKFYENTEVSVNYLKLVKLSKNINYLKPIMIYIKSKNSKILIEFINVLDVFDEKSTYPFIIKLLNSRDIEVVARIQQFVNSKGATNFLDIINLMVNSDKDAQIKAAIKMLYTFRSKTEFEVMLNKIEKNSTTKQFSILKQIKDEDKKNDIEIEKEFKRASKATSIGSSTFTSQPSVTKKTQQKTVKKTYSKSKFDLMEFIQSKVGMAIIAVVSILSVLYILTFILEKTASKDKDIEIVDKGSKGTKKYSKKNVNDFFNPDKHVRQRKYKKIAEKYESMFSQYENAKVQDGEKKVQKFLNYIGSHTKGKTYKSDKRKYKSDKMLQRQKRRSNY